MMRTRKKKDKSSSTLKPSQKLLRIYQACCDNATDLRNEAQLLFENKHHARAYVLGLTALEELGKAHIVADVYTGVASDEEFYSAFRDHSLKISYLSRYISLLSASLNDAIVEYDPRAAKPLIKARMNALYVSFGADMTPKYPNRAVSHELVSQVLEAVDKEIDGIITNDEYFGHLPGTKGHWK